MLNYRGRFLEDRGENEACSRVLCGFACGAAAELRRQHHYGGEGTRGVEPIAASTQADVHEERARQRWASIGVYQGRGSHRP